MSKEKACWLRNPPDCPVRVPVRIAAVVQGVDVNADLGELFGCASGACVRVGNVNFEAESDGMDVAGQMALDELAKWTRISLAVGGAIRRATERKPVLAMMVHALIEMLASEADDADREVLRSLITS
jgi:hypothetical protein